MEHRVVTEKDNCMVIALVDATNWTMKTKVLFLVFYLFLLLENEGVLNVSVQ